MKLLRILLITLFLCLSADLRPVFARPSTLPFGLAGIIHVPADAPTIQQGIDQAQTGDTVLVAEGTFYENISFKGKSITVASQFLMDADTSHISKTIIDGSNHTNPDSGTVVYFVNGETKNSVLYGFTITGGSGTYILYGSSKFVGGGGVLLWAGGRIENNRIMNNVIDRNGEIWSEGAGIEADAYSNNHIDTVIIKNNEILHNTINAFQGGGIGATLGTKGLILFENNIVKDNIMNSEGGISAGGIFAYGGTDELGVTSDGHIDIYNNIIQNNGINGSSGLNGWGGGIYIQQCSPKIYNNIIIGNFTTGYGGGINVSAWSGGETIVAKPIMINNTITNNTAQSGGGIYTYTDGVGFSIPFIMNSIVWGNTATSKPGFNISASSSIQIYNSIVQEVSYQDLNNSVFYANPLFADTLYNLSAESPCVGRGLASLEIDGTTYLAPATDFAGNPRPSAADPLVDIGAYESEYEAQAYPSSYALSKLFFNPVDDFQHFTADIVNHHLQNIQVFSKFYNADSSVGDSVEMLDDGEHADGAANDGLYGGSLITSLEETFSSYLLIQNNSSATRSEYDENKKFTSIGPLKLDHYTFISTDTVPNPGDMIRLDFFLRNDSPTATAKDISIRFKVADSLVAVSGTPVEYSDIGPGAVVGGKAQRYFALSENFTSYPTDYLPVVLEIASNDYVFWSDSLQLVVGLKEPADKIPLVYQLNQNYPNPFNPNTIIKFQIPNSNFVTLEIYNLLGQKLVTLVNEKMDAGMHALEWNAAGLASGIYIYRLQAGEFEQVKKMVLLR